MATHTYVDLELSETEELAGLQGIKHDFWSTIGLGTYFLKQWQNGYPPSEIIDAFSTAMLVRYARPFMTGVRQRLGDEALTTLSAEEREDHDYYMDFRSLHIAHSVNAFEENSVRAYYVEEQPNQGVRSLGLGHERIAGMSDSDVKVLMSLAQKMLNYVDARIEVEQKRLLPIIQAMPFEKLLAMGQKEIPAMIGVDISKRRKRK